MAGRTGQLHLIVGAFCKMASSTEHPQDSVWEKALSLYAAVQNIGYSPVTVGQLKSDRCKGKSSRAVLEQALQREMIGKLSYNQQVH